MGGGGRKRPPHEGLLTNSSQNLGSCPCRSVSECARSFLDRHNMTISTTVLFDGVCVLVDSWFFRTLRHRRGDFHSQLLNANGFVPLVFVSDFVFFGLWRSGFAYNAPPRKRTIETFWKDQRPKTTAASQPQKITHPSIGVAFRRGGFRA